ncbi:murein biosynthesis protein MurJ, partial [Mycobacterium sp. ITM-2017-0098]
AAGATLAGRYRLTAQQGRMRSVQFWRGVDTASAQSVAITLIVPANDLTRGEVQQMLERTHRLSGLEISGLAPIFATLMVGDIGMVISEWVTGGTLREVTDTGPTPTAVAAVLKSLVITADAAHRTGMALGIDHPCRVRISSDGRAVLAFPAPMPDATAADDLRGIGGVLYALLVDRWPPQTPMPDGWTPVELEGAGWPREPAAIR